MLCQRESGADTGAALSVRVAGGDAVAAAARTARQCPFPGWSDGLVSEAKSGKILVFSEIAGSLPRFPCKGTQDVV